MLPGPLNCLFLFSFEIWMQFPEFPAAGSQLKNIVFEIVNSEGDIDEIFHDEPKFGQTHTLTLKTGLEGSDDSVRYAFQHGRCVIPSINLPQEEGSFCLTAVHSYHPEIHLSVKVVTTLQLSILYMYCPIKYWQIWIHVCRFKFWRLQNWSIIILGLTIQMELCHYSLKTLLQSMQKT